MRIGDPRFTTFPRQAGIEQLRWYIAETARGVLTIEEFIADFIHLHESSERQRPTEYASPEEARAIWDVLWAIEFCSLDAAKERHPEDWYPPEEVLAIVRRAALKLEGA